MKKGDDIDPKGLISDAFAIEGIRIEECRSIFLDWALSVSASVDMKALIGVLLQRHEIAEHPMTQVLREGLSDAPKARRRGGRSARVS